MNRAKQRIAMPRHSDNVSASSKTLGRALEVVRLFDLGCGPLAAVQVADATGIPKSSASALLKAMVELGYLQFDSSSRTYFPTLVTAFVGRGAATFYESDRVSEVVAHLSATTRTTAALYMGDPLTSQFPVHARHGLLMEGPSPVPASVDEHPCAFGMAAMAGADDEKIRSIFRRLNALRPDGDKLDIPSMLDRIARIQAMGFAKAKRAGSNGTVEICTPVMTRPNHPLLSLGIIVPASFESDDHREFLDPLRKAAYEITRQGSIRRRDAVWARVPDAIAAPALAKSPADSLNLIVPFATGGPVDAVARSYASVLSRKLKRPVSIVNIPGGAGSVAASCVANAASRGNTLFVGTVGTQAANPVLNPQQSLYDPTRDFQAVAMLSQLPTAITVRTSLPIASYDELVSYSRRAPTPLRYCTEGHRSMNHFGGELLKALTHIRMEHVSRAGAASAAVSLALGEVDVAMCGVYNVARLARAGKARIVAVTTPRRLPSLPAIPTLAELGYGEYPVNSWAALFSPAGSGACDIDELRGIVEQIRLETDIRRTLFSVGDASHVIGRDDLTASIRTEQNRWAAHHVHWPAIQ